MSLTSFPNIIIRQTAAGPTSRCKANIPTFDHNENCVICWSMQDSWRRKSKRRSCTLCQDRAIETLGNRCPKNDVPTPDTDITDITYFWMILDLVWQGKIGLLQEPLDKKHYSCSRLEIGRSNVSPTGKKTSRGSDAYVSPSEAAKSTGLGAREETWNNKEHKLGYIMDHHATFLFKVAVVPTRCQVQYIYILQCFWKIRIYTYWNKSGTSHTSDWHSFPFRLLWASWGPGREKREGTEYAASLSSGMASLHDRW